MDFGIAGLCAGRKSQETNHGTYNYLPPEILSRSNKNASPAIDIWALGCILYSLVFGKIPFKDSDSRRLKA